MYLKEKHLEKFTINNFWIKSEHVCVFCQYMQDLFSLIQKFKFRIIIFLGLTANYAMYMNDAIVSTLLF